MIPYPSSEPHFDEFAKKLKEANAEGVADYQGEVKNPTFGKKMNI